MKQVIMKKYIRTKDGVYEFDFRDLRTALKIYEVPKGIEPLKYADGTLIQEGDKSIVVNEKEYKVTDKNTADTIEELCDVYIIKGEFGIYTVSFKELDEHAMGQTKEMLLSGQLEAYGAIWIIDSDGAPTLKPVAKVNKEGRLELL